MLETLYRGFEKASVLPMTGTVGLTRQIGFVCVKVCLGGPTEKVDSHGFPRR